MTRPFEHVTPGQPFQPQAAEWNGFVDVYRTVSEQRQIFGVPPLQTSQCDSQNQKFVFTLIGPPTGGTWGVTGWTVKGVGGSIASLAYNISASALKTALEAHPGIGGGNVSVSGGPGNSANFIVEFINDLKNTFVENPVLTFGTLTGTGIGAIAYPVQIGR